MHGACYPEWHTSHPSSLREEGEITTGGTKNESTADSKVQNSLVRRMCHLSSQMPTQGASVKAPPGQDGVSEGITGEKGGMPIAQIALGVDAAATLEGEFAKQ